MTDFFGIPFDAVAIIFGAIALGGLAKGVTGLGLPLIAVPVLAGFLGVERAVVIMVIPGFVSNVWMVWAYRKEALESRDLASYCIASVFGAALGTWLLASLDERVLSLLLAAWVGIYFVIRMVNPAFKIGPEQSRYLSPAVGLASGASQGATGVAGPIVGIWFHALALPPRTYVFTVSVAFLVASIAQLVSIAGFGLFKDGRWIEGLFALIPIAIALPLGIRLARLISRRVFDAAVLGLLFVMGVRLAWKGLVGP